MAKYQKIPEVVEVVQYKGDGKIGGMTPAWFWEGLAEGILHATDGGDPFVIHSFAGSVTVSPGDWIIKGTQGELYSCKASDFETTYELVVVESD